VLLDRLNAEKESRCSHQHERNWHTPEEESPTEQTLHIRSKEVEKEQLSPPLLAMKTKLRRDETKAESKDLMNKLPSMDVHMAINRQRVCDVGGSGQLAKAVVAMLAFRDHAVLMLGTTGTVAFTDVDNMNKDDG